MLTFLSLLACPKNAPVDAAAEAAPGRCGLQDDGSRSFAVLHVNDVYRVAGHGDAGGLARVRTLRTQLEAECGGPVLLTHGGDVLFPSALSRAFDARQKVEVLNLLDGDAEADDAYMVAVPGNHDFDKSQMKDAPLMNSLFEQSGFHWVASNIRWVPAAQVEAFDERLVLDVHGVQVGIFGLTTDMKKPAYGLIEGDYLASAAAQTAAVRSEGAEVVLALTHLEADVDAELLRHQDKGPDLVLGGQVADAETAEVDGRFVLKARSDAMDARVAWVTVDAKGAVRVEHHAVALDASVAEDPAVAAAADAWWAAYEHAVCGDAWGCLDEVVGTAGTDMVGTETALRRGETAFGNAIADGLRSTTGADVALVNAGALRLNHDLAKGDAITRRTLEELIAYDEPVRIVEISGARLAEVLDHSVQGWPGHGRWLQVSGVAFRHEEGAATEVHILTPQGPVALDAEATYRVATISWLVDPKLGDQDGYGEEGHGALNMSDVVEDGPMLREAVAQGLSGEILAVVEGRVCQGEGPCLVPAAE